MPRGPSARSAANNPVPQAAPSRSGCKCTLIDKQHQNGKHQSRCSSLVLTVFYTVVNQATKENATAKKALTEALRAHQRNKEFTGFRHENSLGPPESELEYDDQEPLTSITVNTPAPPKATYRNGHHLIPESEPDYDDQEPFTSIAVNTHAPPKTTYCNGNHLVHRVHMPHNASQDCFETAPVSLRYSLLNTSNTDALYYFE